VVPVSLGGTGGMATPTAGGVAYGTGSAYAFTAAGTNGQFLRSGGANAPVWDTFDASDIPSGSNFYIQNQIATVQQADFRVQTGAFSAGVTVGAAGSAPPAIQVHNTALGVPPSEWGELRYRGSEHTFQIRAVGTVGTGTTLPSLSLGADGAIVLALSGVERGRIESGAQFWGDQTVNVSAGFTKIASGIGGAVVFGGSDSTNYPNEVTNFFGTVTGGRSNKAGQLAVVAGGQGNRATGDNSAVSGGSGNKAEGKMSIVAGGDTNSASGPFSAVVGGTNNIASGNYATVAGGTNNTASGTAANVAGGQSNMAGANYASVAGGITNTASGLYSFVAGGSNNTASGAYSFAAGRRAQATRDGCFVWGDSSDQDEACVYENQFVARANGGFLFDSPRDPPDVTQKFMIRVGAKTCYFPDNDGGWSCEGGVISDRNQKRDIAPVEPSAILEQAMQVPVYTWRYQNPDSPLHIGPMAQDFFAAFGFENDHQIYPTDLAGVALAGVQALYLENESLREENRALRAKVEDLERRLTRLERLLSR